jgi:chromosome segregation ATPase
MANRRVTNFQNLTLPL